MDEAWAALNRYKYLADKVEELKRKIWQELPDEAAMQESLRDAEQELAMLKGWIEMHYEVKRLD